MDQGENQKVFTLWSRRSDLNGQPADYDSAALPLSYTGPGEIVAKWERKSRKCMEGFTGNTGYRDESDGDEIS